VEDVVDANMLAMKNDRIGFDVFNIGSGGAISINKLLEEICSVIGREAKPEYRDPREGDIKDSLADITRAREMLGFDPKYDIKQGLEETIKWFRENSDV
jgi:nucleoside-diphosphate-sugar epimerase